MHACETLETNVEHRIANLKNLTQLASVSVTVADVKCDSDCEYFEHAL